MKRRLDPLVQKLTGRSHFPRRPHDQGERPDYRATEPEFLDRRAARPLLAPVFSPVVRASFRLLGIKQRLRLRVAPDDGT